MRSRGGRRERWRKANSSVGTLQHQRKSLEIGCGRRAFGPPDLIDRLRTREQLQRGRHPFRRIPECRHALPVSRLAGGAEQRAPAVPHLTRDEEARDCQRPAAVGMGVVLRFAEQHVAAGGSDHPGLEATALVQERYGPPFRGAAPDRLPGHPGAAE